MGDRVLTYAMAARIICDRGLSIYGENTEYEDDHLKSLAKRLQLLEAEQSSIIREIMTRGGYNNVQDNSNHDN